MHFRKLSLYLLLFIFFLSINANSQNLFSVSPVYVNEITESTNKSLVASDNRLSAGYCDAARFDSTGAVTWNKYFSDNGQFSRMFAVKSLGQGTTLLLNTVIDSLPGGDFVEDLCYYFIDEPTSNLIDSGRIRGQIGLNYYFFPNKIIPLDGNNALVFVWLLQNGGWDKLLLIKLGTNGLQWEKALSPLSFFSVFIDRYVKDDDGNVAFVSVQQSLFAKIDTSGNLLYAYTFSPPFDWGAITDIAYVNQQYLLTFRGGYFCMINDSGIVTNSTQMTGFLNTASSFACADSSNGFYISNSYNGSTENIVSHFDSSANITWSKINFGFGAGPIQKSGNRLLGIGSLNTQNGWFNTIYRTNFDLDSICFTPMPTVSCIPVSINAIPFSLTINTSGFIAELGDIPRRPVISNNAAALPYCYTVSIPEQQTQESKYFLSPNPARNYVTIKCDSQFKHENLALVLTDAEGRKVISKYVKVDDRLSVNSIPAGIYFYTISTEHGVTSRGKLIVW